MLQFTDTEEFLRVAGNFMVKGIMVRHPNELADINYTIHIAQDREYIADLYKRMRFEIAINFGGQATIGMKEEYLSQLHSMFCKDPLDKWLPLVCRARAELRSEVATTNPITVPMDEALRTTAVFQIQSICLMATQDFASFSNNQRIWLGHCYLIATGGDRLINEVLREICRQQQLFAAIDISKQKDTQDSSFPKNAEMQELLALGFTVQHCNDLMRKVLVGQGFKKPKRLSAIIWALLDVLSNYKLITCKPTDAAQIVGLYYECPMAAKPSKVAQGTPYKDAYKTLQNAVKNAINAKKYGPELLPNYA